MRTRYEVTDESGIYFIINTIVEWIPVFTSREYFEIIIDSLKFCRENKELKLFIYVILENHFHLVASGPHFSNIIQSLKRHTSKENYPIIAITKERMAVESTCIL